MVAAARARKTAKKVAKRKPSPRRTGSFDRLDLELTVRRLFGGQLPSLPARSPGAIRRLLSESNRDEHARMVLADAFESDGQGEVAIALRHPDFGPAVSELASRLKTRLRGMVWLEIPSIDRKVEHMGSTRSVWVTGLDGFDLHGAPLTFELPEDATVHEIAFPGAVEFVVFRSWQP